MDVLVIVAIEYGMHDEGKRPYGFAPHVWETGGRDSVSMQMVVVGASVGVRHALSHARAGNGPLLSSRGRQLERQARGVKGRPITEPEPCISNPERAALLVIYDKTHG